MYKMPSTEDLTELIKAGATPDEIADVFTKTLNSAIKNAQKPEPKTARAEASEQRVEERNKTLRQDEEVRAKSKAQVRPEPDSDETIYDSLDNFVRALREAKKLAVPQTTKSRDNEPSAKIEVKPVVNPPYDAMALKEKLEAGKNLKREVEKKTSTQPKKSTTPAGPHFISKKVSSEQNEDGTYTWRAQSFDANGEVIKEIIGTGTKEEKNQAINSFLTKKSANPPLEEESAPQRNLNQLNDPQDNCAWVQEKKKESRPEEKNGRLVCKPQNSLNPKRTSFEDFWNSLDFDIELSPKDIVDLFFGPIRH